MAKTYTVKVVDAGELFDSRAIAIEFSETADDIVWGCNSYSLISQDRFIMTLEEMETTDSDGVQRTIDKVRALETDVYINMEA